MKDFERELEIGAPASRVYRAVSTVAGLRRWWTPLVSGRASVGGRLRLEFSGVDEHIELDVVTREPPRRLLWAVREHSGLEEWNGTLIHFTLTLASQSATRLALRHEGLTPRLACFEDCRVGWQHFLASLQSLVVHGRGAPFGA